MTTSAPSASTLNELFLTSIDRNQKPDAFLIKSAGQYRPIASEEALATTAACAKALEALGLETGDRLAIISDNRLEWALTDYAALGLGAVTVPIYTTLPELDVEYILRDSGAKGIVVSTADQLRKVSSVRSRLPDLKFVLVMDTIQETQDPGGRIDQWWDAVRREQHSDAVAFFRAHASQALAGDTATILNTTATTGTPKGVLLTHSNIVSNI